MNEYCQIDLLYLMKILQITHSTYTIIDFILLFKKSLDKIDIHPIFAVQKIRCRVGQEVKTPPFHGGITGSSPVRGTLINLSTDRFFRLNPLPD